MGSKELEVTTENVTPEVIENVTTEEVEAPAAATVEDEEPSTEDKQVEEVEEEEWKPDYSFKVRDNVHEFDEELKPLITKENHGKIKELYEKAYGLDYTKKRLDQYDAQFEEMAPKIQQLEQQEQIINQLDSMLEKGDFTSFQKTLKIDDDLILKRAVEILKLKELPETERARLQRDEETRAQVYTLEQKNQMYENQMLEQARQAKDTQVTQLLSSPQIVNVVADFDTRSGKPGAFKERVFDYAQRVWAVEKRDLTPQEAIQGFMSFAGINLSQVAETTQPVVQQNLQASKKETLPNIVSSGKAPAKKLVRSIDELRQLADSMRS